MNSLYLLMAQYNGKADIPLEDVARDYLGIESKKAKNMAAKYLLPVPAFRAGSNKSPWMVRVTDLAEFLDKQRAEAKENWRKMNS